MAIIKRDLDHVKPDILLCPPEGTLGATIARRSIKDIHATLHFHPKSKVLMLTAASSRPIVYEHGGTDHEDLELSYPDGKSCVMRRSQNFLRIGDYRFVLEFVARGQDRDGVNVASSSYRSLHPLPLFNPGPMAYSKTCWNVWLHDKIPNTSITAGVNIYTGEPVAVKRLQKKTALRPYTKRRLQVACQYDKKLEKRVLGVIDQIFYSTPLAKYSFGDMPWQEVKIENRHALFHQTLVGLAELHEKNIIHGNILPESLLILAEDKPATAANDQTLAWRAAISLNMQQAKKRNASVCVAPEVWETEKKEALDRTKLDIWALGASWLFAFTVPPKNTKMREQVYRGLQKTLDCYTDKGSITKPLAKLLRQMLAWEPHDRPSVTEALASDAWQTIKDEKQEEEDRRKRKRIEMIQGGNSGEKRVRVLSPDLD
ncbi:hypothetical protein Trco_005384 [Trichoderma cornu-damae]|uniref:Protein kinase domain-containing protein n=1 Tax=Trichoderma cornu-damae TaxID=654480 RepID=A0A9P8TSK2_9HYPO|nr:hypothetical protein Trco_005384 [Trichoderma cornu-damae]